MLVLLDLLRALLDRLLLSGQTLVRGLGRALVAWLDTAVQRGPGGAGGLPAALLELVAVGLALGLASGSAAFGEGRLAALLDVRLLGTGGLGRELTALGEHRADGVGEVLLGQRGVVQARAAGEPGRTGSGGDGAQDLGLVGFGQGPVEGVSASWLFQDFRSRVLQRARDAPGLFVPAWWRVLSRWRSCCRSWRRCGWKRAMARCGSRPGPWTVPRSFVRGAGERRGGCIRGTYGVSRTRRWVDAQW
ncbi:hypothetical protein GCM10009664_22600 [Kitasatospora gansuensis]